MNKQLLSGLALVTLCACAEQATANNYLCDNGLTASIVDNNEDEATLSFVDNTYTLYREVSGSGIKYSDDHVLFWSKGDEAMLILKGKKYHCQLKQS
ncbi:hypothetical protein E5N72_03035 [Pseudoalteromonas sp. MEBiC 03607]|uniref:MliC family protein n=1 Tax=Pseudoalteromonas sp. MEBiC 03607 TaxID=2563601 RepID=UPI0010935CA7|nr:MliC family protein [Pseudoalteromonas sp. MEBiC 03607]TGV19105.1 hypothetical protein E5N72_03035 [Pseudoalteromonas sp. MEBiC 03607]